MSHNVLLCAHVGQFYTLVPPQPIMYSLNLILRYSFKSYGQINNMHYFPPSSGVLLQYYSRVLPLAE